ncbi:MAG TPA: dTDP-4-amino-4,6-dideoxygalactose transaminase [Planctomycetota bacterium]|nr:dTDP-4-amino-4,6-dideoxygalactose transaminase [Planctomycetota bacterium]
MQPAPARSTSPPASAFRIPFNRPAPIGQELEYVAQAVASGKLATDGEFCRRATDLLRERLGTPGVLLMSSCTNALEIAVLLAGIGPGDEVILPSYTFVSTANAVVRAGGTPVFVDVRRDTINLDEERVAAAIGPRTRAILPVHYAGVGCAMHELSSLARARGLRLIEDAAHAIDARYDGRPLGTLGDFGTFSFHETKNVVAGEGGALVVADLGLMPRAEVLRNKGTDRARFERREVDRYTWVGPGSSCGPSELQAAFLCAQLEGMTQITARRRELFQRYLTALQPLADAGLIRLPVIPVQCQPNAHVFYLIARNREERVALQSSLHARGIQASTHYVPLHDSPFGKVIGRTPFPLPVTEEVAACLLRLPLYHALTDEQADEVAAAVLAFFGR